MKKSSRSRASKTPAAAAIVPADEAPGRARSRCTARERMADPTAAADAAAAATDRLEEVVVTGLRQSLVTSETIKRDSPGVVDAITAEDIGKFPDTNLAESIQRIPGVTIDRNNNEGSRVTVRGFGPEFNLVTLNGRSMPGSLSPAAQRPPVPSISRTSPPTALPAFTVYKTGRADVASGGIGSTINITTARPFDFNDHACHVLAPRRPMTRRARSAARSRRNSPACSATRSSTIAVGFLVNGSYSKRNSREQSRTSTAGCRISSPPAIRA